MTCVDCKHNVTMVGCVRCYDCELRRITQLVKEEKEDRPASGYGLPGDPETRDFRHPWQEREWTAKEILDREG